MNRFKHLALGLALLSTPLMVGAGSATEQAAPATSPHAMSGMGSMQMSGDVDRDFVMMMRKHHQDGIAMAQEYLPTAKDPRAKQFAQQIITAQTRQIGEFDRWLQANQGRGGTGAGQQK